LDIELPLPELTDDLTRCRKGAFESAVDSWLRVTQKKCEYYESIILFLKEEISNLDKVKE